MSAIRVLRVIARMNVGGPALEVAVLTDGLNKDRFEQRLLIGDVEADEADYVALRAPGLPVERVEGLGRSIRAGGDARALVAIRREIKRYRPHIVHTHTAKAGALARTAARAVPGPLVVHTFHGHLLQGYFSPAGTAAVIATERLLARWSDRLLAGGAAVRDELLAARIGVPSQYVVVPPGVQLRTPPDRRLARQQLGLAPESPVIAFVARLTGVKRPDRFLEVVRRVGEALPTAQFLVVGEGPLLDRTRRSAAAAGANVQFLGWRSDVEVIYAAADVALLTSDNEGMPLSLIEAALAARPAVATDVGSVGEVVLHDRSGYVVPPAPEALANALVRLLSNPARMRDFGVVAQEHAELNFGIDRLVRDTEDVYEDLIETRLAKCAHERSRRRN